jgi:hypothetical protein
MRDGREPLSLAGVELHSKCVTWAPEGEMTGLAGAVVWVVLGAAQGACPEPWSGDRLDAEVASVEAALRVGDRDRAHRIAAHIELGVPCLQAVVPYASADRIYRAIGAGLYVGGDVVRGREWMLTALELNPGFQYQFDELAAELDLVAELERLRPDAEAAPELIEGKALKAGATYLDGALLGHPAATTGRPHVFQANADPLVSTVIEGNAFPERWLYTPTSVDVPVSDARVGTWVVPNRPKEKTPLMIGGALGLVGSGGLYWLSTRSRSDFDAATTRPELEAAKRRTNTLVLATLGTLGAGTSVLGYGLSLPSGREGGVFKRLF